MLNHTVKIARVIAAVFLGFAVLAPSVAHAQAAPMDMSSAIRPQMNAYNHGHARANAATMQYMQYMQQLRAAGHPGPSLPTGASDQTMRAGINASNQVGQGYK